MVNRIVLGLVSALSVLGLAGCTAGSPNLPSPAAPIVSPGEPSPLGQDVGNEGALPIENGITGQIITLPDDTQLAATGENLPDVSNVHAEILGIGGITGDPVVMAAGNHVTEIRQEEVILPIGKAILAVVVRGQPAAAGSYQETNELWLIAVRKHPSRTDMRLAYAIIGTITGDEVKAKAQLLELGQRWRLPAE